ncbi:MAG TPA: TRAM domain-containing protein, partial [Saliniramus sp.]|nr:TRAM domain-containing protein [Saliniramus sp.]
AEQVPAAVMSERLLRLQALLDEQRHAFNHGLVGRVVEVLVEKPGRHEGQLGGKTPYLQAVHFEGLETLVGEIVPVRITRVDGNSLNGETVGANGSGSTALMNAVSAA